MTVADVFQERLKTLRAEREWTQNRLATRLEKLGSSLSRGTLAKIECGKRQVLLDDAIEIAVALDVSLVRMLVPADRGAPVDVAPNIRASAREVRRWIEGWAPLPGGDDRAWFANLPREEWLIYRNALVGNVILRLEKFADDATSDDEETRENAIFALDNLLANLNRDFGSRPADASARPPQSTAKKPKLRQDRGTARQG